MFASSFISIIVLSLAAQVPPGGPDPLNTPPALRVSPPTYYAAPTPYGGYYGQQQILGSGQAPQQAVPSAPTTPTADVEPDEPLPKRIARKAWDITKTVVMAPVSWLTAPASKSHSRSTQPKATPRSPENPCRSYSWSAPGIRANTTLRCK